MPRHKRHEAELMKAETTRALRKSRALLSASKASLDGPQRPPVILELGPRDYAVAVWTRDDGSEPIYKIVQRGIKAFLDRRGARPKASPGREAMMDRRAFLGSLGLLAARRVSLVTRV